MRASLLLLPCLLAVGMCFIPLLSLLGYESAAATGALLGFIAAARTARQISQGTIEAPLDPARRKTPTADWARLLTEHLLLIPLPMLIMALNALRVQNCDLGLGVQFWLIIPTGAVLMGQSAAWAASILPRGRLLATAGLIGAELAAFGYRFAWQPPITGHQWFIGYFSGSIYDEALALPSSLLWYRVGNLFVAAAVVLGVEVAWRRRTRRPLAAPLAGLLVSLVVLTGLYISRFEHGVIVHRADAIAALGGHLQTEHFDIYYDPGAISPEDLPLLAEDHEYNYAQLSQWLELDVVAWRDGRRIGSFVYPDSTTQKQLLGSRRTMVARPWSHELHIRWRGYAESALPHELAHIFSAALGAGPLQLPTQGGWLPNIGMLEGFAEAADWPDDELDPHTASAAMRRLEQAPDLRGLLDPLGFWSQPSRRAYTLMGSFVRYLADTYGVDKLKGVYGRGDFQAAYGRSAEDLITEWEGFIDERPLSERELALAAYLYQRGSIFQRVCARTIGELSRQAGISASQGQTAAARVLWDEIVALEPGNPSHRLALAAAQAADRDDLAASVTLSELLSGEPTPALRAAAHELQGDIAWRAGLPEQARVSYARALEAVLPESSRRRLVVKRHGAAAPAAARAAAARYLLEDNHRDEAIYAALRWSERAPSDPVPAYLTGLLLYRMGDHAEAVRWLGRADRLPDEALREERGLLLARARYLTGDLDRAARDFARLSGASSSRVRVAAQDGLDRVAWKRTQ
ncbi:MAG: tetratricopeptide (TPR) repeat protein [Myxococcota bacterium]